MNDLFCAYYTDSNEITTYMVSRLFMDQNDLVLEPSAGEGAFVEKILKGSPSQRIDCVDINEKAVMFLKQKFSSFPNVEIRQTDTLLDEKFDGISINGGLYDCIIGNPPYGAWQDYAKRDLLKKKYPGQYVKETYSLFLLRCLTLLKEGGRLSFIIPDTFLFLNLHKRLREIILRNTVIDEILIFPSKFFPGVSFGYSNLCIVSFKKCQTDSSLENCFSVYKGFLTPNDFLKIHTEQCPASILDYRLKQSDILNNDNCRFLISNGGIGDIINKAKIHIGDIADVVTGFYSGDNKKFIKVANESVKGSKGYQIIQKDEASTSCSLEGIDSSIPQYVPYLKGNPSRKYLRDTVDWFVEWDKGAIDFYKTNKKSRFQNSSFYFKAGIALPMIKSSVIKATLMDGLVFDQSIVGVFPKDPNYLYFLLGLLNSPIVNDIVHTINPTANNSSNYIKAIPVYIPSKDVFEKITDDVKEEISLLKEGKLLEANKKMSVIDESFARLYNFK